MWLLSDFAESEVRVKQYVRNGRIVRSYSSSRDTESKKEETPKKQDPSDNVMQGSLGIPLTLIGIAGLVGVLSLTGNKGVAKVVEEKVKVEKVVAVTKSPILSKLPQDLQDLRALYQSDKSSAMTSFYGGIDKSKPQEARLKFAQMVAQKEITPEEASKIVESYDKATSGSVAVGTFKQNVVKKVDILENKYEKELVSLQDSLDKYNDPDFKGRIPSGEKLAYIKDNLKKLELQKKLVKYDVYGEEFAKLGSGKTQMEQKQYLFLQEYLADDPKQYKEFKNYVLGGSLIQANKGQSVGFSAATSEEAVRNAFEYGYTADDIAQFNTIFGMSMSKKEFKGIKNIYKKPKSI